MAEKSAIAGNLRDTNIVQKARPMSLLRTVPFSFGELKILDTYLSRIDSHDPEHCEVTFTKAEYEELMGIGKSNLATLKKHTKGMLQKVVEVPIGKTKRNGGYLQFVLFDAAECEPDENGVPTITLSCTQKAKRLFFEIDQIGYLRYELRFILALKRQSSYLLYMEVLRNRYRLEWIIPLEKLRDEIFDLKKAESYKVFKDFKRYVLDPAVKEVNEKTDCHIEYEPIKRGRKVTAIKFKYTPNEESEEQMKLSDIADFLPINKDEDDNKGMDERYEFLAGACKDEFTAEEMAQLFEVIVTIPEWKLPQANTAHDSKEIRRYHYLAERYAAMNRYQPKHRLNYLLKIIKDDANAD